MQYICHIYVNFIASSWLIHSFMQYCHRSFFDLTVPQIKFCQLFLLLNAHINWFLINNIRLDHQVPCSWKALGPNDEEYLGPQILVMSVFHGGNGLTLYIQKLTLYSVLSLPSELSWTTNLDSFTTTLQANSV